MSVREGEIGIVGAGPAGARAAELLADAGADVFLFDPKAPWEKPCGGGITAGTFDEVPELRELDGHLRRVSAFRLEAPRASLRIPLSSPMAVIDRADLSRWQLERAVAAGAEFVPRRVRGIERKYGRWRLRTDADEEFGVRGLVGADGAASVVRRAVRPGFQPVLAPTRVVYPGLGEYGSDEALFRFVPGMDGYVWDFPRPDRRSVGAGVSAGEASRAGLERAVAAYWRERTRSDLNGAPEAGAVIGTAGRPHDYADIGASNWALLGDAAGFADPVTGEGIRNALRSAACLADAYWEDGDFRGYPARAETALEDGFRLSRKLHRLLHDHGGSGWMLEAGARTVVARALLAALLNGANEHDFSGSFLGRWWGAYRQLRAVRSVKSS